MASPASPSRARATASLRSGSFWRSTSSITAVAMPPFCMRAKGWPALTAFSCAVSPTRTTRAMPTVPAMASSLSIATVPIIEASSTASTVPPRSSRACSSRTGSERSP